MLVISLFEQRYFLLQPLFIGRRQLQKSSLRLVLGIWVAVCALGRTGGMRGVGQGLSGISAPRVTSDGQQARAAPATGQASIPQNSSIVFEMFAFALCYARWLGAAPRCQMPLLRNSKVPRVPWNDTNERLPGA